MVGKKKKQSAEFAKDKNAFAGGSSKKENSTDQKAKQKQSGAHQPRDADITSGHDVQKPGQSKTLGHNANHSARPNDWKPENKPDKEFFRIIRTVFRVMQRKHQDRKTYPVRKQSPVRKNADSRGSSKRKTALRGIKKRRTLIMREAKHRTVFQRSRMPLRRRAEGSRPKKQKSSKTITAAGTLTTRTGKKADTAGVNIRTGNAQKMLTFSMIIRQMTMLLQKKIPLQREQRRNFRAARN